MTQTENSEARRTLFDLQAELPPETFELIVRCIALCEGLTDICPRCGVKLTGMKQVEYEVYGSCGCMLYTGSVMEKWDKPLDTVQIRVPVEKMPRWERILYWIATRF